MTADERAEALAAMLEDGMERHAIAHRNSNSPYGHVCERRCRISQFEMLIERFERDQPSGVVAQPATVGDGLAEAVRALRSSDAMYAALDMSDRADRVEAVDAILRALLAEHTATGATS